MCKIDLIHSNSSTNLHFSCIFRFFKTVILRRKPEIWIRKGTPSNQKIRRLCLHPFLMKQCVKPIFILLKESQLLFFYVNFVIWKRFVAILDTSECWLSILCLKRIAYRLLDRIYHSNCNAEYLIEYLQDRHLPFQKNLVLFLIYAIFNSLMSLSFVDSI